MQEFPKQVEEIAKKVRVLDGTNNKIKDVPEYMALAVSCHRLGLSKNRIGELPDLSPMISLRVLLLDCNRLRSMPSSLCQLAKLERLNLAHNYIIELPRAIGQLKQLKYLDVSGNKLAAFPAELGGCESLEEIHASDNAIARLPVDLAKLERLRTVVAENNMIDAVPPEMMLYCESLQTLALHGNPLTLEKLQATKGYAEFEARRKAKWDKSIAAGVLLGGSRFDEGADRAKGRPAPANTTSGTSSGAVVNGGDLASEAESRERRKKKKGRKSRLANRDQDDVNAHALSVDTTGTS